MYQKSSLPLKGRNGRLLLLFFFIKKLHTKLNACTFVLHKQTI